MAIVYRNSSGSETAIGAAKLMETRPGGYSGSYSVSSNAIMRTSGTYMASDIVVSVPRTFEDPDEKWKEKNIQYWIDSSGVLEIGDYAFCRQNSMSFVEFPSCKKIGMCAFQDTIRLQTASFPECLVVGSNAFRYAYSLETISFPKCVYLSYGAFFGNGKISDVTFPECVAIDNAAFWDCTRLENVSATKCICISGQAFQNCGSVSTLSFPNAITLGWYAFQNCSMLKTAYLPKAIEKEDYMFYGCDSLETLTVGGGRMGSLKSLPSLSVIRILTSFVCEMPYSDAFESTPIFDSTYLGYYGSIYVPSVAVESFKTATNWACYSDRIAALSDESDFDPIQDYVNNGFHNNTSITEIPSEYTEVSYVGGSAFAYCYSLTSAIMPNCEYIGGYAFVLCGNMSFISFPNCRIVNMSAFRNCSKLQSAIFPNCVLVSYGAFYECRSLTMVSFPSCIFLSGAVFNDCQKLESAYFLASIVTTMNSTAFWNTPMSDSSFLGHYGSIYVRASLVDEFKAAEGWSLYADRIVGVDVE